MFDFFKKKQYEPDVSTQSEKSSYIERQEKRHQRDKNDLIECFYRGVNYSPEELQALNDFLDGVVLKGYKFFHSYYGNMIMVQEANRLQRTMALPINYDRFQKEMSVDKEYIDISYDCAMAYGVVQPLIDKFNKDVREKKMEKNLNASHNSDKKLLRIKRLIKSHLDFYLYDNSCDYTQGKKTKSEWKECDSTIKKIDGLVDFAFNQIQEEEEDESITWSKLDNAIKEQLQDLNELDAQLRNIKISKKKGGEKMDKIYVPIYDNGEPFEDNATSVENVCFKNYWECVKWIEEQEEDGVHYKRNDTFNCWEFGLDDSELKGKDILNPDGFYIIEELTLKD